MPAHSPNSVKINGNFVEENETDIKQFSSYEIEESLVEALKRMGYIYPTKIQSKSLEYSLKEGDLLCLSETGSGKTLSFLVPILNQFLKHPETLKPGVALIIVPTR